MRVSRSLIVIGTVAALVAALALPASAEQKIKEPVDATDTLDCGTSVLDITIKGWFQVHQTQEGNGIRVTTFHQTSTYTNPDTAETLVIQNTGVARVYFDDEGNFTHALVAGHSHLPGASGNLIYGLQDPSGGFAVGHEVSPCESIG